MKRGFFYSLLGLVVLLIGGYLYLNYSIKKKVETFLLEQLSPQLQFHYEDLNMDVISGSIALRDISIRLKNSRDTVIHTTATINLLQLKGFGYWSYFVKDEIQFDQILIDKNNVTYYKDRFVQASKTDTIKQNPLATINKGILVKSLEVEQTNLKIFDKTTDSVFMLVSNASLEAKNVRTSDQQILKRIPITYEDVEFKTDSIKVKLSPYEDLLIKSFTVADKNISIENLILEPKFTRKEYVRKISVERDYSRLKVPNIEIESYDFGFNASRLYITIKNLDIDQPEFKVYRDKSVADDTSSKPLYSKVLRTLPVDLLIDSVHVNNALIVYEEKLKKDQPSGNIGFDKLDLSMTTIGNMQSMGTRSFINAKGLFQDSPLDVKWSFDIHDTSDAFRFNGSNLNLPAININSFTAGNLNVGFKGQLSEIYFDISGTNRSSTTKMKMAYKDFKIDINRKGDKGINKLLSGIANLFVKSNSQDEEGKYREGTGDTDRDETKSIFNFIGASILSALIKTMT